LRKEFSNREKFSIRVFIFLLILSFGTNIILNHNSIATTADEPIFTITAVARNSEFGVDEFTLIKNQLGLVGINLEVTDLNWPWGMLPNPPPYVGDYDLTFMGSGMASNDPDVYSYYYTQWGQQATQIFVINYEGSLDYQADLGMGKNEWYLKEGALIFPQDSEERINHYWEWQEYLMDDIVPIKPLYTWNNQWVSWSNLQGFDPQQELVDNMGSLDWQGVHDGQTSEDQLTIPIVTSYYGFNGFYNSYCLEPLIKFGPDKTIYPHLAKSIEYIDNTTIRIHCREGIKWQDDPVGNFTDEYFTAEDVYFSLSLYRDGFNPNSLYAYDWIGELELINETTVEIGIDYNSNYFEWGSYSKYYSVLKRLNCLILPEHFLNQTQFSGYPDSSHLSWEIFEEHPFGTGLFEFVNYTDNVEENYSIDPNCWWFNSTITSDPLLDWNIRFGTFDNTPTKLKIKVIGTYELAAIDFESGAIDYFAVNALPDKIDLYQQNNNFTIKSTLSPYYRFVGYNLKERGIIGSRELCPYNSSLTIGLAIRKAISYLIDANELNDIINGGKWEISYGPITETLGIWYNPNVEKYDYNLQKAKEYLAYAGYGDLVSTSPVGLSIFTIIIPLFFSELLILIIIRKKKK